MSRERGVVIFQVGAEELRVVRAHIDSQVAVLSDMCSFWSRSKDPDGTCLKDQTVLDAVAAHVEATQLAGSDVVFVLNGSSVACNHIEMPPLTGKALRQAVLIKLGQQLHFPLENAVVAISPAAASSKSSGSQLRVQATAAHRDVIDAVMQVVDRFRFRLLGICAGADVLAAAAVTHAEKTSGIHAVVHIEEKISTLVVVNGADNHACVCAEIPMGTADMTAALMRPIISGEEVIQLTEEKAAKLRNETGIPDAALVIDSLGVTGDRLLPLLEPFLQKFLKQLTQWLSFAATTTGGAVTSLELVGSGAAIPGLAQAFAARTSLKVQTSTWLERLSRQEVEQVDAGASPVGLTAAAGMFWRSAPDLVPPKVRSQQRLGQIRKTIAVCSSLVAASIVLFAVLFDRVGGDIRPVLPARKNQLANVQQSVNQFNSLASHELNIQGLERQFDEFGAASPHWVAVFKELSLLLPTELMATEYAAETDVQNQNIVLTIRASVVTDGRSRNFDEVVRQTLLLLQRSAFFNRVELVSANREQAEGSPRIAGSLSVRLDLAYPRRKARA